MKKKIRRLGDIMLDMEILLEEMAIGHDLQYHEMLGIIYAHLVLHYPESQEEFLDGKKPKFEYK